jgi:hypothetical protein
VTSGFFQDAGAVVGLLGGAVGLLSGAVTFYDRLSRYRPYLSIYADLEGQMGRPWPRVTNRAPFDIFLEIDAKPDDLIGFTQQQTVDAMAAVMAKEKVTAVVKPMEAAQFLIVQRDKFKSEQRPTEQIKIKVHWYRQRTWWRRLFPVTMPTSINDIEERTRAAERGYKELGLIG